MKSKVFVILLQLTSLFLFACGQERGKLNPLELISSEITSPMLVGNWQLEGEMDYLSCPDLPMEKKMAFGIHVTEEDCNLQNLAIQNALEEDSGCRAGEDDVIVYLHVNVEEGNCSLTISEVYELNSNPETQNNLEGNLSGELNISGDCPQDLKQFEHCVYDGNLRATRNVVADLQSLIHLENFNLTTMEALFSSKAIFRRPE